MTPLRLWLVGFLAIACATHCWGFHGQTVTEGPLALSIGEIPTITRSDQPQTVQIFLTNHSPSALSVRIELRDWTDACRGIGETQRLVEVPASGEARAQFQFLVGAGSYSAMYPIHAYASFEQNGKSRTAHAVRIFETALAATAPGTTDSQELPLLQAPRFGPLRLANSSLQRLGWQRFGERLSYLPVGWQGSEPQSGAFFGRSMMARGETRQALQVHPPYKGGVGRLFVEYRIKLPAQTPLRLEFFNAIRDTVSPEPPSDGVSFRAWVSAWNATEATHLTHNVYGPTNSSDFGQLVFERHVNSTHWQLGRADLSPWAGQEILLRLEAHPGPRLDPTCDLGFWGDPVIWAGAVPARQGPAELQARIGTARAAIERGRPDPGTFVFNLKERMRAALVLGPNGVADGVLAFGSGNRSITFEGLQVALHEQLMGSWPAGVAVRAVEVARPGSGRVRIIHRCEVNDEARDVVVEMWVEQAGLRVSVSSAARITDIAVGRADRLAKRVFYGHGYCMESPQKFTAWGGGHDLSTSHVAIEWENGLALLTACDSPPDDFVVDPEEKVYALHAHPNTTFTFVPSLRGAFDCALQYRPLYDKQAAPAVAKKAGRFVFDLWGGRYADDARSLRRCFDYGLTNALVIMHAWQRWGYDYRLPDIFPPHPGLGSLEDLRSLGDTCRAAGVLWGVHDNYIDFYPDATGFSYDHIVFDSEGKPRRGWLNEGVDAQAWQFRPDHVRPFLKRNLDLIAPALHPSASFVDVWTSMNAFDYFDRHGDFHSKLETRKCWGEGFALIRDTLGNAPTTSEAGSDQLIGWLDGADCQFLMLAPQYERFRIMGPCRDWERVPWFDVVNHTRFSLHGVGYSDRYQGGRSREDHGIASDDYLSAELLTGHALMMDLGGLPRAAVRKYWLAQDFIQTLARDEIRSVEFADSDIHRLTVNWKSGATVRVNRGTNDWMVDGRILPPYGYWAKNRKVESAVERIGTQVVEHSRAPGQFYVNGRGFNPDAPLAIRPKLNRLEPLGGRDFKLWVDWQTERPAPKDLAVFYHFTRQLPGRYSDTEFYGGGGPQRPASQWVGQVTTGPEWAVRVPDGMPPGEYEIVVGLYDPANGHRYRLLGDEDYARRYRLGRLVVEGEIANGITNVSAVRLKTALPPSAVAGLPAMVAPTDFGFVRTSGAMRIQPKGNALFLQPLPEGDDFEVSINLQRLPGHRHSPRALHAVDAQGKDIRVVTYAAEPASVRFTVNRTDFGYRLDLN